MPKGGAKMPGKGMEDRKFCRHLLSRGSERLKSTLGWRKGGGIGVRLGWAGGGGGRGEG